MSDRPNNQEVPNPDADSASSSSSSPSRRPAAPPQTRTHQHLDTDALSAFLDNRLEADQRDEAAGHIAVCADCRRELRELRATVHLLRTLPQYTPRRSFVLGNEFAHPVRTNRLIRFLPLLPAFRIAAAAVFVLLLGVGAADVLTEIGNESNNSSDRTAQTASNPNDTAMLPAPTQSLVGDGTGGSGGLAAGGDESGTKPTAPPSSDAAGSEADADSNTARNANTADSDTDAAFDSESAAESSGVLEEDTGSDDEAAAGSFADSDVASESGASASEGEAPAMAAAQQPAPTDSDDTFSEEPAADVASDAITADSPPAAAAGGSAGEAAVGQSVEPTAPPTSTPRPSPTATAAPTEASALPSVSMADNGPTTAQKANSGSSNGLSTWRLIELTLAAVLIVLALLVFSLQRLATRARKIGLVR